MKKRLMSMLSMAGMLGMIMIASHTVDRAQVIDVIKVEIPFSFYVRDKQLPAGSYEIRRAGSQPGVMEVINRTERMTVMFITNDVQAKSLPNRSELIFTRYGEKDFLSEIFEGGSGIGVELPKSRMERRIERSGELAELHTVGFDRSS